LIFTALALAGSHAQAAFVQAYDDASDAAYNSGWTFGSNGGFGFGSWFMPGGTISTNLIGDSNGNGTAGGPGINTAGKSWQSYLSPNWQGAAAGRSIGMFGLFETFEIDVDFGITGGGGSGVALFAGSNFLQVNAQGTNPLLIHTNAGTISTTVPYSDGGYRILFSVVNLNTMDVKITSLASASSQSYLATYGGIGNLNTLSLQHDGNSGPAQSVYANRMEKVFLVPEPASMSALGLGIAACLRKRRKA
jgi:hypothetical protein